tara:strand:- start:571 stop:2187 length:1617 start_codon:yes stop_codon:yes gene_type:complete
MYLNKKIDKKFLIYSLFFFVFLLVGIYSFDDYGISIDENYHYTNGLHYYSFLKGILFPGGEYLTIQELRESFQYHHFKDPAIFDLIIAFITDLFNLENSVDIILLRHLLIFLIFFIGTFYFFLILKENFNNNFLVLFGLLFLILSPRIFANSFYNNKDLIFLSVTCIFFYYSIKFFLSPSYYSALMFGIFSSLAFDIRIMAIIYIFTFYVMVFLFFMDNKDNFKKNIKYYISAVIFSVIFTYIFWPYLWIDPINNLIDFFSVIKNETPAMQNLYFGKYIFSKNIPWHYEFMWILITSPICIISFFLFGYFLNVFYFSKNLLDVENPKHKFWFNKKEFIKLYIFCAFTLTFVIKLKFGVMYGGWRQIYYLYPLIIFFGLIGLEFLLKKIKKKIIINFIFLLIITELTFLAFWNFKNHPFQFVYFNPIFKSVTKNRFDLDYWGISNKFILKKILEINKNQPFKVTTVSFTNLNDSLRILSTKDREKIAIVYSVNQADFVIDNYMKKWSSTPGEENLAKNFKIVYNLIVDKNIINTVYQRN